MELNRDPEDDLRPRSIPERTVFPEVLLHPAVPDVSIILSGPFPKSDQECSRRSDVKPSKSAEEPRVVRIPHSYKANRPIVKKSEVIKSSVNDRDDISCALVTDPLMFGHDSSERTDSANLRFSSCKTRAVGLGLAQIDGPPKQITILKRRPVNDPEIPSGLSLPSGCMEKPVRNQQKSNEPGDISKRLSSKMDRTVVTHECRENQNHLCSPPKQDSSKHRQKMKSKLKKCLCDLEDSHSSDKDMQSSNHGQNIQSKPFTNKTFNEDNQTPSKLSTESLLKAQWEIQKGTSEVIAKLYDVTQSQVQMMHKLMVKVTDLQVTQEKFMDEVRKSTMASTKCPCSPHSTNNKETSKKFKDSSSLPKESVSHKTTQTSSGISRVSVGIMTEQLCATGGYDDSVKDKHFPRTMKSDSLRKLEYPCSSTTKYPNAGDESLALNDVEIGTLEQPDPSPQPSLHLDLQDFRESSEEETESNSGPFLGKNYNAPSNGTSKEPAGAGWTLYNNVVGQVNKYLQSAPSQQVGKKRSEKEDSNQSSSQGQTVSSAEGIRYMAIEQIHKLGVSVYEGSTEIKEVSTTRRMKFDSILHPHLDWQETGMTEQSTEMDASLQKDAFLKYRSDDQLNAAYGDQKGVRSYNRGQKCTNMSSATLQYLEKYKLLPHLTGELEGASGPAWRRAEARRGRMPDDEPDKIEGRQEANLPASHQRNFLHPVSRCPSLPNQTGNILDVTNLKKQPKLL